MPKKFIAQWIWKLIGQTPVDPVPSEEIAFVSATPDMSIPQLGRYASSALRNPAINAALDKMEADLARAWRTSTPAQGKERESAYYRQEAISEFKAKLNGMVRSMLVDDKIEKQKEKQREVKKILKFR